MGGRTLFPCFQRPRVLLPSDQSLIPLYPFKLHSLLNLDSIVASVKSMSTPIYVTELSKIYELSTAPYLFNNQIVYVRYVAKQTHTAYGTISSAAAVEIGQRVTISAMHVIPRNPASITADFIRCSPKNK